MEEVNLRSMDPDAVRAELFNSIIEEVVSEVNLPAEMLEPARLLGFHRSNLNGGKPNAEFLVRFAACLFIYSIYVFSPDASSFESNAKRHFEKSTIRGRI